MRRHPLDSPWWIHDRPDAPGFCRIACVRVASVTGGDAAALFDPACRAANTRPSAADCCNSPDKPGLTRISILGPSARDRYSIRRSRFAVIRQPGFHRSCRQAAPVGASGTTRGSPSFFVRRGSTVPASSVGIQCRRDAGKVLVVTSGLKPGTSARQRPPPDSKPVP